MNSITKEQREYLNKLAISAIKELEYVPHLKVCSDCKEHTDLYQGNRKNLLYPRCRKCNLKQVIDNRFNLGRSYEGKVRYLEHVDVATLENRNSLFKDDDFSI